MPILDRQRRGHQIGRLRLGQKIKTANGKIAPTTLDTFRFTTASRYVADAIADLYGGTVRPWERQFEVITDRKEIEVTVPPRDQVISQWYELWSGGGAMRRCDSRIEKLSEKPCLCPHAEDPDDLEQVELASRERARLASLNPPQACKPITRISVMIPDLPGLGVFRLDTASHNAADEIGDVADLLQFAREHRVLLPARVSIEYRERLAEGKKKRFPVPVLEILSTFREIASGALAAGGITAQLPPPPGQQPRALTAGAPAVAGPAEAAPQQTATAPRPKDAQEVANLALKTTDPDEVDRLARFTHAQGWDEDYVQTADGVIEELRPFLRERWDALRQPEGGEE